MSVTPDTSSAAGRDNAEGTDRLSVVLPSAVVAFTGALGVLLGSVPDIGGRLGVDTDA